MSPTGAGKLIWFYAALSILWGLFLPLIELVLIISVLQPHPILEFWRRSFSLSLIELMRAWGKSMMWSFLFIIPGVVRFVQYLFVPFVVCLDPLYQLGERDALAQSRKLSRGRMGRLFFFFFLSAIVVPALLTVVDEWRPFVTHPVSAFLICILQMIINLTFSFWLWKIYQRSAQA